MSVPPMRYAPKLEVLWRYKSRHAPLDATLWRVGIIANGSPKAPLFCEKKNCWMYPVIVERPTGPRIMYWVREGDISATRKPLKQFGGRSKATP